MGDTCQWRGYPLHPDLSTGTRRRRGPLCLQDPGHPHSTSAAEVNQPERAALSVPKPCGVWNREWASVTWTAGYRTTTCSGTRGLGGRTPGEAAKVNAPFQEWADVVRADLANRLARQRESGRPERVKVTGQRRLPPSPVRRQFKSGNRPGTRPGWTGAVATIYKQTEPDGS